MAQRSAALEAIGRVRDQVLPVIERPLDHYSKVGAGTFFDPEDFDWIPGVEAQLPLIQAELEAVLEDRESIPLFQELIPSQAMLTDDDKWRTYTFYGYGVSHDQNIARCPETARIARSIPGMTTAFFSILAPGKHIPPHRGFYKGVLRYHLGLKVPAEAEQCRIRVGDDIRHWTEGGSLVFDDTFEHQVWNDTDEERVVFFVDFLRPLPQPLRSINRGVVKAIGWSPEIRRAAKAGRIPT
ncbi:MAG: aspartyl/asparaginyl beta-hydroxylase domain-containing protein [Acidimicrobiia bacterium]